ncbi:hypothetical protein JZ751_018503 [Albula glossodonta]|uniref:SHSP domain-containing protein n=1 Tax=Albula glossodonta TaxID=121402 RepID=A0A8T2NRP8_9TELE|nr:hypothetical protein JZ751_018503 [Albula glossodonta]
MTCARCNWWASDDSRRRRNGLRSATFTSYQWHSLGEGPPTAASSAKRNAGCIHLGTIGTSDSGHRTHWLCAGKPLLVHCDRSGFNVHVDVKHFCPEELMVKVTGDFVEVHGKHEQRKDGTGLVSRQFNRRYRIPEGVDVAALESAVSPEGILVISAPLLQGESSRPLSHTGP